MKRKWFSGFFAAVTLLCLVCTFPTTARAASNMTVSEKMISVLKTMEGFSAKPYWDNTQWSVGYGTRCPDDKLTQYQTYGISEADALALLGQALISFQTDVNNFMTKHALTLKQHQFDALVSFSYNCGSGWMNETAGYFNTAVREQGTVSEFLYGICLYSSAGSDYILMDRRLCEANMYINGVYKAYNADTVGNPDNLKYVFLDGNGGEVRYKICGFDAKEESPIRVSFSSIPTGVDGQGNVFAYELEGWYTASGTKVEALDSSLKNGDVLYARWKDPAGNRVFLPKGTPENLWVTVAGDSVNVRRGPATYYEKVGVYTNGAQVQLTEVYETGGYTWGKTRLGWFRLDYSNYEQLKAAQSQFPKSGTITTDEVNYRTGPSTSYSKVGQMNKGDRVTITEEADGGSLRWGKMSNGYWVCLDYVCYDGDARSITSVTLVRQPDQSEYVQKTESLKLEGSVLLITYSDGTSAALTLSRSMITAYNNNNLGNTTVTASYEGYTVSFPVSIVKATVTFRNWDGTVLSENQYAYGETVVPPAAPTRADKGIYTYTFSGWDAQVTPCAGNAVYTAVYQKTEKAHSHPHNGWYLADSEWYYYENGALVRNAWRTDSDGWVWLSDDGSMLTNDWTMDSNGWCYVGENGRCVTNTWLKDNYGWVYMNSSGYMTKDAWVYYQGNWYRMDSDGYMITDSWAWDSAGACYLGRDGAMVKNTWVLDDGKWYWMDGSGRKARNLWIQDSSGWCYLTQDGTMATNTWLKDSKGWCYVGDTGYCLTNTWMKDSLGWCYLGGDGRMVTRAWVRDGKGWCYLGANGYMATNCWVMDSQGWCYLGADGYCVTNAWMKDSKGWVWLDASGRMATNAWVKDSVGWCYVGADGYAVTNCWKRDSVGWCYLNSNGSMTKNAWVLDGGKWYYLDANGYMLANTSRYLGGKTYYFNASGVCTNP